jgi:hypothetical protein
MWSTTVRNLKLVVVLYWGILVFAACAAVEYENYHAGGVLQVMGSFAVCTNKSLYCVSELADQIYNGLTTQFYNTCDCIFFLSSPFLSYSSYVYGLR